MFTFRLRLFEAIWCGAPSGKGRNRFMIVNFHSYALQLVRWWVFSCSLACCYFFSLPLQFQSNKKLHNCSLIMNSPSMRSPDQARMIYDFLINFVEQFFLSKRFHHAHHGAQSERNKRKHRAQWDEIQFSLSPSADVAAASARVIVLSERQLNNLSTQWCESRQQINVIQRPSSRLF